MAGQNLTRRSVVAGLAVAPFVGAAQAQTAWPARPVRVMVPYPPAGGADTTARILFQKVGEILGQQFVIENRGGAGGTIGEAVVAKAEPDGYTILHDATGFSVNGSLYPNLPFDYNKDFDPVFLASLVPNILVVTPSLPVNTLADVIAYAKAPPDGIDIASSGNGTLQHLCLEMFRHMTGVKVSHVPYRGGGLCAQRRESGQVKFFFANGSSVVGLIQGGKVKAIAHTGKGRLESLPDIPPVSDTLPGFEAYEWNGVFVPHGTPTPIVNKLNAALNEALQQPEVTERFKQLNIDRAPEHAGGIRRLREGTDGEVGRGGEGSEDQAGVICHSGHGPKGRAGNPVLRSAGMGYDSGFARFRSRPGMTEKLYAWNERTNPPRIAGPVAQPKAPRRAARRRAPGTRTRTSSGRPDKFPYTPGRGYTPPDAPVESYVALLDHLGFARGVVVQGNAHGYDNRVVLDALARYPRRLRGVAITDTRIAPGDAARLARARHARLALPSVLGRGQARLCARRRARRVRGVPQRRWPSSAGSCRCSATGG